MKTPAAFAAECAARRHRAQGGMTPRSAAAPVGSCSATAYGLRSHDPTEPPDTLPSLLSTTSHTWWTEKRGPARRLELTVPDVPAHIEERDGLAVIVTDGPMEPMSVEETRAAIDRVRR